MNPDTDNIPSESLSMPGSKGPGQIEATYKQGNSGQYVPLQSSKNPNSTPRSTMALPSPGAVVGQRRQTATNQRQQGPVRATQDDDDLSVEKEAIARAVAITHRTSTDPYVQAVQIAKVKADFLRKRYGKDIKLSEGK